MAMPSGHGNGSKKDPEKPTDPLLESNWQDVLWYLPLALVLLWFWQDMAMMMTVHTVSYSEFKDRLAAGEVKQCEVGANEIVGRIEPKSHTKPTAGTKNTTTSEQDAKQGTITSRKAGGAGKTGGRAGGPARATDHGKAAPRSGGATAAPKDRGQVPAAAKQAAAGGSKANAGKEKGTDQPFAFRTVRVEDPKLVDQLEAAHVEFAGVHPGMLSQFLIWWVLPLGLVFLLWTFMSKRIGAAGQAVMSFGRSKARLVADKDTGVRFDDVAGCDEAKLELEEVVEFLRTPEHFVRLGARIPKGVLLVGPPGTGKTLMARAVAGEAGVSFFSISGSDFVEMFVGVGAARVRDLFQQGKRNAPCIIFIDELDAIGRTRGIHMAMANDEREQTLNQLLVEMDGFQDNAGVIILAATNRPEVLDRALLRPGRFDRQVLVDAPDLVGREAVLKVHAKDKPLGDDVDLRKIAQATPGFSGADLANALNEAALLAARRGAATIGHQDLENAVEKVVAGPERKSRRLDQVQRVRVAHHEVGHALVAAHSQHADPVRKISIIPRGRAALGYTLQLPTEDQFLLTRSELLDRLRGMLGGRAAEEVVYNEISTGAENDLEKATSLARQMVCMYGMSEQVGLVHCVRRDNPFQPEGGDQSLQRDCSEQTAEQIDDEVKRILDQTYREAKDILSEHRDQLERVASALLEKETLDADQFQQLLSRADGSGDAGVAKKS